MSNSIENQNCFVGQFESSACRSDDFSALRERAFASFREHGFPTTQEEDWRYTDVSHVAKTDYQSCSQVADLVADDEVAALATAFDLGDSVSGMMVFVNGRYSETHSRMSGLDDRITAGCFSGALAADASLIEKHLGKHASISEQGFASLNTALFEDLAYVHVPREVVLEKPIQVLHVSSAGADAVSVFPRNLIIADTSSQVAVVETYAGTGTYLSAPVSEIVAADNAQVDHYHVERESDDATHMATIQIHQAGNSHVASKVISLDGEMIRHDMGVVLDGEGADCNLRGVYMVDGKRHVDNQLHVDHAKPHCDSREFFKGILDGEGRGVFRGRILVREHAQKTDAKQTNQSLLLSKEARVESKPQLEIFADDVKCTHGATIGQIDESALFYLQTRGLSEEAARTMMIYAFACESLDEIKVESLREQVNAELIARLPQGDIFK